MMERYRLTASQVFRADTAGRTEIGLRIHRHIPRLLIAIIQPKPLLQQNVRHPVGIGLNVHATVFFQKRSVLVVFQHPAHHRMASFCTNHTGADIGLIHKTHETAMTQEGGQGFDQFLIRVQIHTAMLCQRLDPHIIRHKGILFCLICLLGPQGTVYIKAILIPANDLPVRAELFPAFQAFFHELGHFTPPKPAIMYDLRNHTFSSNDAFG